MKVDGVLIGGPEAVELVRLIDRAAELQPELVLRLSPLGRLVLRELNVGAAAELRRRRDAGWRAGLVPLAEAAELLGIPPRTLRRMAASGRVAAERGPRGWMVDPAA